ncbi:hypothetical protein JZO78_14990 [Enterococcus ureilyticus]|uniref:hypothetical protein n=1 Tax=Enterococcus ureilyticus TaxID=1131292 RepID=UPI001A9267ED|nr:hypothetical protein [Enterococcus ureilyticus]MBO0447637.1 hypothetical protein [Enterococcus ureilyticus]
MIKIIIDDVQLTVKMGWSFISISNQTKKLVLPIEQRVDKSDIVNIPSEGNFDNTPITKIKETLAQMDWNRDITFIQSPIELELISFSENEYEEGSLESTSGGQEFLNLDLFDPDNDIEKEVVKELWLNLETRFAEAATGFVSIYTNSFDDDSVFNKITIPTLLKNDNVTLNFIDHK